MPLPVLSGMMRRLPRTSSPTGAAEAGASSSGTAVGGGSGERKEVREGRASLGRRHDAEGESSAGGTPFRSCHMGVEKEKPPPREGQRR